MVADTQAFRQILAIEAVILQPGEMRNAPRPVDIRRQRPVDFKNSNGAKFTRPVRKHRKRRLRGLSQAMHADRLKAVCDASQNVGPKIAGPRRQHQKR